jgi:hypothetical protein
LTHPASEVDSAWSWRRSSAVIDEAGRPSDYGAGGQLAL